MCIRNLSIQQTKTKTMATLNLNRAKNQNLGFNIEKLAIVVGIPVIIIVGIATSSYFFPIFTAVSVFVNENVLNFD